MIGNYFYNTEGNLEENIENKLIENFGLKIGLWNPMKKIKKECNEIKKKFNDSFNSKINLIDEKRNELLKESKKTELIKEIISKYLKGKRNLYDEVLKSDKSDSLKIIDLENYKNNFSDTLTGYFDVNSSDETTILKEAEELLNEYIKNSCHDHNFGLRFKNKKVGEKEKLTLEKYNSDEWKKYTLNINDKNLILKAEIVSHITDLSLPKNCGYTYTKCNSNCKRSIIINQQPARGGVECPPSVENCPPGVDDCPNNPVDCVEGYSSCQIIDGKCMKKNIIYAKSQYGGKKCVNEEYIECDDGEGSCPLDCKGEFTRCDSNCNKKFKVLVKEKNGGKCPYEDGEIVKCKHDDDDRDECVKSIDCDGYWSECDENCEKTFNINRYVQGNGENCRFKEGDKLKCSIDDNVRCQKIINKDCVGRWSSCNSKCKKRWIIEDGAKGSGTCPFEEGKNYDCNEGIGECEVSKDCIGRWSSCNDNCESEWHILKKEKGLNGRCDFKEGQKRKCKDGQGLCIEKNDDEIVVIDSPTETNNEFNYNILIIIIIIFLVTFLILFSMGIIDVKVK